MIEAANLSFVYNQKTDQQKIALNEISFKIDEGEILGVIGSSGSGKSCLLRCIASALPVSSGKVMIKAKSKMPIVGLVIQEPEQQFFMSSLQDEVGFALSQLGQPESEVQEKVIQVLSLTGYHGSLTNSPFKLSGGEQRRVALASILIMDSDILLLDEPTVGMDAGGLQIIRNIIDKYRRENRTVFIASHDLDFLYGVVDRFLVLNEAELIADFKTTDFLKFAPLLAEKGVGIPEVVRLQKMDIPDWIRKELNRRAIRDE